VAPRSESAGMTWPANLRAALAARKVEAMLVIRFPVDQSKTCPRACRVRSHLARLHTTPETRLRWMLVLTTLFPCRDNIRIDPSDLRIFRGGRDSQNIASRLGTMERYLCAAPVYLERRGTPCSIEELRVHDRIETPGDGGRPRSWIFCNDIETVRFEEKPRLSANDTVTIHRLIVNGGGIGVLSAFICAPDLREGRLVRLLPEWKMPALEVSIVFPSSRALSQTVRAFVDFLKTSQDMEKLWRNSGPSA
jgi:DNA-binding transcriptional LysR family regulator